MGERRPWGQMKQSVIDLNHQHPDWTARQIAERLNCTQQYVNKTAARNGLSLAKVHAPRPICAGCGRMMPKTKQK